MQTGTKRPLRVGLLGIGHLADKIGKLGQLLQIETTRVC
jgi:hypothetical protein